MRLTSWLLLTSLGGLGCGSSAEGLPFEPAGPAAAPDPMAPGPFPVGVKTLELVDGSRTDDEGNPRRLRTEIWYPAAGDLDEGPFWEYEPEAEASEEFMGADFQKLVEADLPGMQSHAVRDADLDREHGPYPLVVFSHGAYGVRWQSVFYTPHLASHGFVVVSCDHLGHTVWELLRDGFDEGVTIMSSQQRMDDVGFLIDHVLAADADPGELLHGMIARDKIGTTGHSYGGWTSVTTACIDRRIDVAVAHSPIIGLATLFGCDLDAYPVPLMVMGGTEDMTVEWRTQYCDYATVRSDEKYLYELAEGGHYTFSDICDLDLLALAEDFDFGTAEEALHDGCSVTDNIPWPEAHKSINHYTTAMFNIHLRGSIDSRAYLVDTDEAPFGPVSFYAGEAPDWPDGCEIP